MTFEEENKDIFLKVKEIEEGRWDKPSKNGYLKALSSNGLGRWGERKLASALGVKDEDISDSAPGEYDLLTGQHKLEVKTSTQNSTGSTFQHEGFLKEKDFTMAAFLCVSPERMYVKFVKKEDIPWGNLTHRAGTGSGKGYKYDLSSNPRKGYEWKEMVEVNNNQDILSEYEKIVEGKR